MKICVLELLLLVVAVTAEPSLVEIAKPLLQKVEEIPRQMQMARSSVKLYEVLGLPKSPELEFLEAAIISEAASQVRTNLEGFLETIQSLQENEVHSAVQLLKGRPSSFKAKSFLALINNREVNEEKYQQIAELMLSKNHMLTLMYSFSDWWESIKNLWGGALEKYDDLKAWVHGVYDKVVDASKPIIDQVKHLATEFLKQNWDSLTVKIVRQALLFFWPMRAELGVQIVEQLIKLAKKFNLVPWEENLLLLR